MIPKYLSAIWLAIAPELGNHLWQSTLFAVMTGLLTLLLQKNHARNSLLALAGGVGEIPHSLFVAGQHRDPSSMVYPLPQERKVDCTLRGKS